MSSGELFVALRRQPHEHMSFQITTQPLFGTDATAALPDDRDPLAELVLHNTATGEFAIIIPGYGGMLRQLVLRQGEQRFSVIEAPESPQALFADETYSSRLLYPFPGRIEHGVYTFEGVDYALHMNETRRNHALHGLVYTTPFAVISEETTETMARLTLRYTHTGEQTGYPFPFELTISYTLTANGLTLAYSGLNNGSSPSPSAFGWHPYFTLKPFPHTVEPGVVEADNLLDEMTLTLPVQSVVVLGDDMMPTGTVNPLATNVFTLKNWEVDAPFIVSKSDADYAESRLTAPKQGTSLVISQQTGPGKLGYLVVFTPPKRDRIAIEPQTANVNAFNTGEGLAVLEPGDALDGWIRVQLRGVQ